MHDVALICHQILRQHSSCQVARGASSGGGHNRPLWTLKAVQITCLYEAELNMWV